jgi:hypothetical protein
MKYAGLTDEPKRRKQEHGNPADFKVMQQFSSETAGLTTAIKNITCRINRQAFGF